MNIIITTRKQHPVSDETLYALAQQSTVDRCWHLKNGRPATPPVEKKQSRLLALYSKDEIPTLSRKVYFSVLSDVAAKDKSPASLLLRNIFFHETSGILLADSRQRARCIIAAKTQSAGLRVLSFPFHGIGLGINAAPDVIERKICFALQRYCFIFKEKRVNKK